MKYVEVFAIEERTKTASSGADGGAEAPRPDTKKRERGLARVPAHMAMPFLAYLLRFRQGASKRNGSVTVIGNGSVTVIGNGSVTVVERDKLVPIVIASPVSNSLRTKRFSKGKYFSSPFILLVDRIVGFAFRTPELLFENSASIVPIPPRKMQERNPVSKKHLLGHGLLMSAAVRRY